MINRFAGNMNTICSKSVRKVKHWLPYSLTSSEGDDWLFTSSSSALGSSVVVGRAPADKFEATRVLSARTTAAPAAPIVFSSYRSIAITKAYFSTTSAARTAMSALNVLSSLALSKMMEVSWLAGRIASWSLSRVRAPKC